MQTNCPDSVIWQKRFALPLGIQKNNSLVCPSDFAKLKGIYIVLTWKSQDNSVVKDFHSFFVLVLDIRLLVVYQSIVESVLSINEALRGDSRCILDIKRNVTNFPRVNGYHSYPTKNGNLLKIKHNRMKNMKNP